MKFLWIALFLSSGAYAQTPAVSSCALPKSTSDVVTCLAQNHPDIVRTRSDGELTAGFLRSARQFPNPVVYLETNKGKNVGDVVGEDNLIVSQLVEIGGKRAARAKRAEAERDVVLAQSAATRAQVRIETILGLVKYRQLSNEIAVLNEALTTYGRVHSQYAARPRLAPEQQVSFGILKLAMGDYRHKLAALMLEKRKVENFFRLVPELNFEEAVKHLPQRFEKWPVMTAKATDKSVTPRLLLAEAEIRQADADVDLARAQVIPDPTISLISTRQVEGFTEFQRLGIGVSLPIPLWNQNGGAKQTAVAQKTRAEIDYRKSIKMFELERQNLLNSYQGFVDTLAVSPAPKDIESKHRNTESLFFRGVISGILVVEAHRQILEFTQTQNELELETIQTLLSLYLFEGRLGDFKYD